ncbi:unnamed protein product [Prorocentrum cordatum]|uniref:Uncharacterized protein n=1 Tax=Prorocentrum cordatum TaxID=2364126 RepID=A0ABN9UFI0_9DINO|nr:unnamed protein product [Polarella glacialis]
MLWGPLHYDVSWYCKFKGNSDGTISPKSTSTDLVLGFGKCLQKKQMPPELAVGDRDQCILVPHSDPRRLVVRRGSHAAAAPSAPSAGLGSTPLNADYFSFEIGGDPSQIVDRFRAAQVGDKVTFFRNQKKPGPGAQPGSVACESYTIRGNTLSGAVSATLLPNGDITWSHGYISRPIANAAAASAAGPPAVAESSGPSVTGRGGRWLEYTGDAEIIRNWRSHTTLENLKRTVELKGYSAITVSNGHPSFGHAALKKFPYQLKKEHCKPISTCCRHPCKLYIYDSTSESAPRKAAATKSKKGTPAAAPAPAAEAAAEQPPPEKAAGTSPEGPKPNGAEAARRTETPEGAEQERAEADLRAALAACKSGVAEASVKQTDGRVQRRWRHVVAKVLKQKFLKGFWAVLGEYLNYVKRRIQNAQLSQQAEQMQQQNVQIRTELARQVQAQWDLPRLAEQLGDAVQKLSEERKEKSSAPAFSHVDTKGLGKPSIFKNEEAKFLEWYRKTNAYLTAIFGEQFRKLLEWVEDQAQETTVISMEVLEARFGSDDDNEDEFIPDLREKVSQLYVALQTLTEGESFALVMNTPKGNGAEAMRKLIRRWDPASGGKRRVLLKQIMNPQRCTLSDLYAKLEEWEELIRRYERKKADGMGKVVDDDVKVAALETMVPEELELHLAMNKRRLDTSEKVVEEIRSFLEPRQSQGALLRRKRGDPMDVDSLYKGGKGKSKGKGDKNGKKGQTPKPRDNRMVQCWRCSGWGHTSNECTARLPGGKTGDGKGGKGKGKGKDTDKDKSKGKNRRWDTNSFEPGAASSSGQPVCGDNWEDGNNSTVTSLPPSASQVGSTNLGSFELCAFELNSFDETVDDQEWIRFTFDSGAAVTTFPENTKGERLPADPNASYRTASGEIIADSGGACIQGRSEWSEPIRLKARLASIHKPLVSASQTHRTGRATWLTKEGGYILPAGSDIVNRVDALIRDAAWSESGVVPLYVEKGIYAGYIKKNEGGHVRRVSFGDHRESWDLCPVDGGSPVPHRQAEREQHLASGHAVYRSWCEECARAAGLGAQHARRPEDRDDADPVVSMDFAFIGEKVQDVEDDGSIPILVVTDRKYGMKGATAVKDKTASDFVVKWLVGFLKHLGHRRVVLKSDGEASICAIKNAVMVGVGQHVECIPQESPKGEHKSNGEVEASVKEVKKVIRANFFSMQKSFGFEISPGHPIVRWLPQFAADSISKFRLGVDGMSAEQRRRGRPWRKFAAEFGERVHYRPLGVGDERSTLAPKMLVGHFVGYHSRTGALLVMTQSGVVRAQGFKRLHRAQAWSPEAPGSWGRLAGLPWEVSPAVLLAQPVGPITVTRDTQEDHDTVVRRRYVLKKDIERFGATPGCPGCADLMARGSARVAHSQECRDRIEAELMKDSAGQRRLAEHHLRASAREAQAEESAAQPAPQPGAAAASGGGAAAASGGGGAAAGPGADVARAGPRASAPATPPAASRKRAASVSAEERRPPQLRDGPRGPKRAGSEPDLHGQMIVDGGSSSSAGPASAAVSAGLVQPAPSPEGARGGGDMEDLAGPAARAGSSMDVGAFDEVKGKVYWEILALVSATDLIGDNAMSIKELKEVSALLTEINGVDLAEVYSPERFKGKALGVGLTAGLAADLYTGWDLLREDHRRAAMKKLLEDDPLLTVTSPPCTVFSKLRQLSNFKRDEGIVASEVLEGETHLEFSMKVCESRHQRGALFLHEHPWGASSWSRPCVQRVKELPGVYLVRGPMCRWGLHSRGPDGREAFVRKETGWLTNSQVLAGILAGECRCPSIGGEPYRHVHLLGDKRALSPQVT